jgi:hypothetical protein
VIRTQVITLQANNKNAVSKKVYLNNYIFVLFTLFIGSANAGILAAIQ